MLVQTHKSSRSSRISTNYRLTISKILTKWCSALYQKTTPLPSIKSMTKSRIELRSQASAQCWFQLNQNTSQTNQKKTNSQTMTMKTKITLLKQSKYVFVLSTSNLDCLENVHKESQSLQRPRIRIGVDSPPTRVLQRQEDKHRSAEITTSTRSHTSTMQALQDSALLHLKVRRLRQEVQQDVELHWPRADPHWREALQVRPMRQRIYSKGQL